MLGWSHLIACQAARQLQMRRTNDLPLRCVILPLQEVRADFTLQWTTAATIFSIAFFNFFGVRSVPFALGFSLPVLVLALLLEGIPAAPAPLWHAA